MTKLYYLFRAFIFCSVFFVCTNIVLASDDQSFYLQPAENLYYYDNLYLHKNITVVGTSSFLSSTYIKGVTFFNGTMINSTVDENGNGIPITIGDDLRVDGVLYRIDVGGEHPIKVADSIIATDSSYSLGSSSNPWNNVYANNITIDNLSVSSGTDQVQSLNVEQLDSRDSSYYTNLANNSISNQSQGDILYYNGTQWQRLEAGTSGQYLQTQGTESDPQWATVTSGGGGSASQLSDLIDVNTSTPTNGNILIADGTDWESVAQTQITKLGTITSGNVNSIVNKSSVGLGSVENTALTTWAGTSNITTLGTIGTGIWQGTAIADAYIPNTITASNYLAIANNLSDLNNAGTARTNLSLVPGTNIQAYDVDLTTYAGITPSANVQSLLGSADYAAARALLDLEAGTDFNAYDADLTTYAGITPSANIQTLLGSADYSAARTNLSLVPGTDVQVYDADLTTYAGITPSANIQTLLGSADYATARTNLGITASVAKENVRVASTEAVVLASGFENLDTIDDIVLATNDRILIKNQASGEENGIYTVNASGAPTRATDFDVDSDISGGVTVFIEEGTANGGESWVLTNTGAVVLNTTALTFSQYDQSAVTPTSLGLVINTNIQAYDVDLTTYAGITPSANVQSLLGSADYAAARALLDLEAGTDFNAYDADLTTYAGITPSANIQTLLGSADYSAARTNLSLVPGTDVQAYDVDLADIAGLTPTDSNFIVGSGASWVAEDASTARTSIGLGNVENTALTTWVGSNTITTVGSIGTGTWQGTDIAVASGGTGASTAADAASNLGLGTEDSPTFSGQTISGANGSSLAMSTSTEVITVPASTATADSTANLIPANSFIIGAAVYVTDGIAAPARLLDLGPTGGTSDLYINDLSCNAAGANATMYSNGATFQHMPNYFRASASKVTVTLDGATPVADPLSVRVVLWYYQTTAPTS